MIRYFLSLFFSGDDDFNPAWDQVARSTMTRTDEYARGTVE